MTIHKEGFKTLKVLLLPIFGVIVAYVITGEINFWGKVVLEQLLSSMFSSYNFLDTQIENIRLEKT